MYIYIFFVVFENGVFFPPMRSRRLPVMRSKMGCAASDGGKPLFYRVRGFPERSSYCKSCEKYAASSWGNMLTMRHLPTERIRASQRALHVLVGGALVSTEVKRIQALLFVSLGENPTIGYASRCFSSHPRLRGSSICSAAPGQRL